MTRGRFGDLGPLVACISPPSALEATNKRRTHAQTSLTEALERPILLFLLSNPMPSTDCLRPVCTWWLAHRFVLVLVAGKLKFAFKSLCLKHLQYADKIVRAGSQVQCIVYVVFIHAPQPSRTCGPPRRVRKSYGPLQIYRLDLACPNQVQGKHFGTCLSGTQNRLQCVLCDMCLTSVTSPFLDSGTFPWPDGQDLTGQTGQNWSNICNGENSQEFPVVSRWMFWFPHSFVDCIG
jgi:hypothetical protein